MTDDAPILAATPARETPPRETPKSLRTRARILEQATSLFAEIGYAAATNARIAEAASLTRGAMLYHFPTREALVDAAVDHIQTQRTALLAAAADAAPHGADLVDHAIDAYWSLLRHPAFMAFRELEATARIDADVRARIVAAQADFDQAQAGEQFSRMLQAGAGPRFQASRDLARFMLEGLARATLTYDRDDRVDNLLGVIKRAIHMLNRKGDLHDLWPEDGGTR
jgi:AcrR family transcriptional regulator